MNTPVSQQPRSAQKRIVQIVVGIVLVLLGAGLFCVYLLSNMFNDAGTSELNMLSTVIGLSSAVVFGTGMYILTKPRPKV